MGISVDWLNSSRRLALALIALGAATCALGQLNIRSVPPQVIQKNKRYEPVRHLTVRPAGEINTYSFFPQIDTTISQRGIVHRPGENGVVVRPGKRNEMAAGKVDGSSFAVPSAKFPGIGFTGLVPADPNISTGPGFVVEVVNSQIAFLNKNTGAFTFSQSSLQFFSGLGAVSFQFDPRVIYDHFNNRWIIIYLAEDDATSVSQFLIAVSDDSDPNGTWRRFLVDNKQAISGSDCFFDYPMVGFSQDAMVISGNLFTFASSSFAACSMYVVRTAGLYGNTGFTATNFVDTNEFNIQPADGYTAGSTSIYAFCAQDTLNSIRVYAFTDVDTATPSLTSTVIPVQSYDLPDNAPSGGNDSETLGWRAMDAGYRDGFLVGAHTIEVTGTGRSSVRWYEIDLGTWPASGLPSMAQQGNITLPVGQWAYMPAICKNASGAISIIYTRSSSSIFSDLVVSSRTAGDPPGVIGAPTLLRSGVAANSAFRWGDYFAAVTDPDNDDTFWGDGMVTRADGLWSTEIMKWIVQVIIKTEYDPLAISTIQGTPAGGGLAQILTSDDTYYNVNAVLVPGIGYFATNQVDFTITEPIQSIKQLKFTVEAHASPTGTVTGTLFLWNWTTGAYEIVNSSNLTPTDLTIPVALTSDFAKYINGSDQIRMAFRAHDPFRVRGQRPQPFTFGIDYVHLQVSHT